MSIPNSIFPAYELPRRLGSSGRPELWDPVRRRWVAEQPEEEVRQLLIQHLIQAHQVGRALIGVEKEIRFHSLRKRFDVVVFNPQAQPLVLCECKAPTVVLSETTLQQIARYNASIRAPHLLITNGVRLLFFSLNPQGHYQFQPSGWFR